MPVPAVIAHRSAVGQPVGEGLTATREAPHPVFVVGSGRADRALLRSMLDAHRNISCKPETELAPDSNEESLQGLASQDYPDQYWFEAAAHCYANLQLDHAASRGKGRWVELVDATTLRPRKLDRLFPTCRIIHVVGDGWTTRGSAHAIRVFAARIPSERYCEIQAAELVTNPEWAVRRILGFLGETWDPTDLQTASPVRRTA